MNAINEEVDQGLVETWELFDEKARNMGIKYSIEADEPLRQIYSIKYKTDDDKAEWTKLGDQMAETGNVKNGRVIMKIDPGYKKHFVMFEFTKAAVTDGIAKPDIVEEILEQFVGFFSRPHITLNQKFVVNATKEDKVEEEVTESEDSRVMKLAEELEEVFKSNKDQIYAS